MNCTTENKPRIENSKNMGKDLDEERQINEAATLEVILNNVKFHSKEIPIMGKIEIYLDVPKNLPISMDTVINGNVFRRRISVNHLPPVILFFHMPKGYPSKVLPNFLLHCTWLPDEALSIVCSMLDHLWEKTQWEVLFDWVSFIRQDLIQFLDLDEGMSMIQEIQEPGDKVDYMREREQDRDILEGKSIPSHDRDLSTIVGNVEKLPIIRYVKSGKSTDNQGPKKQNKKSREKKSLVYAKINGNIKHVYHRDPSDSYMYETEKEVEKKINDSTKEEEEDNMSCNVSYEDVECKGENVEKQFWANDFPFPEEDIYREIQTRGGKPYHSLGKNEIDQRVLTRTTRKELLIDLILDLNEKIMEREFFRELHECEVCFETFCGRDGVWLKPCQHEFCNQCISEYLKTKMGQPNLHVVSCPASDCSCLITEKVAKTILDKDTFVKYQKLVLKHKIDSNPNLVYCPRNVCKGIATRTKLSKNIAYCAKCELYVCTYCLKPSHGDLLCQLQSEERRGVIQEYQMASHVRKLELEKIFTKTLIQEWVNTDLSIRMIEQCSKKCPNRRCAWNIEKNQGCNKMTCINCNTYFCWLCDKILDRQDPYDHFVNEKSKCYQKLFPIGTLEIDDDDDDYEDLLEDDLEFDDEEL